MDNVAKLSLPGVYCGHNRPFRQWLLEYNNNNNHDDIYSAVIYGASHMR